MGKQTIYKHFNDKEQLFAEIVLSTTDQVDAVVALVADTLSETDDLARDLAALARRLLTTLMRPEVLRLRRMVIASADRFPDLGRTWYEKGFERVLATLAESFTRLADRGLLHLDDPAQAAAHFVGLLLWIPLNKAMFTGNDQPYSQSELHEYADSATDTFLAAHEARRS